jgi:hypothetical protein
MGDLDLYLNIRGGRSKIWKTGKKPLAGGNPDQTAGRTFRESVSAGVGSRRLRGEDPCVRQTTQPSSGRAVFASDDSK